MQYRDNSYTVPLVKNNKLAALLLRFDPRSQTLDAIPAPIIAHFLKDASGPKYQGFPSLGISFFPTRDPELRAYAGDDRQAGRRLRHECRTRAAGGQSRPPAGDIVTAVGDHADR